MEKVAVIGAGISGLSTAHFLQNHYDITVFEKEETPGGLIRCKTVNGSLFHICGGHVFNSKRKDVLDWFWSILSKDDEFLKTIRNSIVFFEDGKRIPYPIENHLYLFKEELQKSIIDDLLQIYKRNNEEPQNFADFLKGRFGNTLYDLYFKPYNEKIWCRDLKQVPLSWLEGKLPMPTVQEIIYNNINHIKENTFVHSTFWYEKEKGSQYIADKLALGLNIQYNTDIDSIILDKEKWIVSGQSFDKIVFCGNIKQLVSILKGIDIRSYKEKIDQLDYHGTTAVFCEIDSNPYSWIYQPSNLHRSHRIICTGNFSPSNNNPKININRITATIEFTDNISKEEILVNLSKMPLNPTYLAHYTNTCTYPIQNTNTRELIQNLKSYLAPFGFYFTGRFADWEYYNMDAAMGAAMDMCKSIKKDLQ